MASTGGHASTLRSTKKLRFTITLASCPARPALLRRTPTGLLFRSLHKAADGNRTHDLILTKDALYQLSYSSDCSRPSADTRGATNNPACGGYTTTMAKNQIDEYMIFLKICQNKISSLLHVFFRPSFQPGSRRANRKAWRRKRPWALVRGVRGATANDGP